MKDLLRTGDMVVDPSVFPLLKSAGLTSFRAVLDYSGGVRVCHKRGRSVFRIEIDGRTFYLKRNRLHRVEFWKALCRLRIPSLGAGTEWENILAVQAAGIPTVTPVAVGERSRWGLETASFTLTEEIYNAEPVDEFIQRKWTGSPIRPCLGEKRRLIRDLAALARRFHGQGMNHRDFYLNHFFIAGDGSLFLLDLQRVQRRRQIPMRFLVKDLGQLAYSSLRFPLLNRSDKMYFLLHYLEIERLDSRGRNIARKVLAKTDKIARHDVKLAVRRRSRGELP